MRVLIVGSGGREHALCWALEKAAALFCAPGNPGTAKVATNLPIPATDHDKLIDAVREKKIDLVVVGPERPLADGLVDRLTKAGIAAFGPTKAAAQIEASKAFAKQVMQRAGVPTAKSRTLTSASQWTVSGNPDEPIVVKASGLAAGKGVIICSNFEVQGVVNEMFSGKFGDAGKEVVIEEFMEGEELSVFALTDGEQALLLPPSQDHKRLLDGDKGPNTGGMGAYAPVSIATDPLMKRVHAEVVVPTLKQMAKDGTPFKGLLYAGLMIDPKGNPRVVEFNCRFGDPETQVVLPLLTDSLLDHLWAIGKGESWKPKGLMAASKGAAVTTVLAAKGYPETPVKGAEIQVPELKKDQLLFHAGTSRDEAGVLRTSGGRVLCATGLGPTVKEAAAASRALADSIRFDGRQYRTDIGWREMARAGAP